MFVNDTVVAVVILEVDIHVFVVIYGYFVIKEYKFNSRFLVEISFWVFLFKIAGSANWVFFLNI